MVAKIGRIRTFESRQVYADIKDFDRLRITGEYASSKSSGEYERVRVAKSTNRTFQIVTKTERIRENHSVQESRNTCLCSNERVTALTLGDG